jgi:hypothetical protein
MDSGLEVRFNVHEHPHVDYGYAVTSHGSQGQTADRVPIHVDTEKSESLVNNHFAYVSGSRAQHDLTSTQMTGASFPVVSVAKVLNLQRPKWNRGWPRRRPNRLASEGNGPPKRSKVIVLEWDLRETR